MATANRVHGTPPLNSSLSTLSAKAPGQSESVVKNSDSRIQLGAVNRRNVLMNMIVKTAAMTASAGAMKTAAAFAGPDPIYTAIKAYYKEKGAFDVACNRVEELEKLARDRFGSDVTARDAFITQQLGMDATDYVNPFLEMLPALSKAVIDTKPTTDAGFLAKCVFIGEVKAHTPDAFDDSEVVLTIAADAQRFEVAA